MQLKRIPTSRLWFMAALVLLALFGIYTTIFSTGILLYPTLGLEQWLLHRPLTGIDCVFNEWKHLGEVGTSLLFTFVLGIVCLLLGYRRRILPYLFLLLLLGVGAEYLGKQYFPQIIPASSRQGMSSLACPQSWEQPGSTKLLVALGIWWEAPPARPEHIRNAQYGATAPLLFDVNARQTYSYPSGHAIRWFFIGFVAFWLAWRHVKSRLLRILLMTLSLAAAFGGGFAQFYIGFHLSTDLIAGYLIGASSACCAIGLLLLDEKKDRKQVFQAQNHFYKPQKVRVPGS